MRICFSFLLCLFSSLAFSQEELQLSGIVVDEMRNPIEFVRVSMLSAKKKLGGVETNEDGLFVMNVPSISNGEVVISCLGYKTLSFSIDKMNESCFLDTLVLSSSVDSHLNEVVVVRKPVALTKTGRVYYPSFHNKDAVGDCISLLGILNIPHLSVLLGTKEVKYWGKGDLKYYINNVEANIMQVRSLPAKDVEKVECINRPGLEYGERAGLVIKISTKNYEKGFFSSLGFGKPLNRSMGELEWDARFNSKGTEVMVDLTSSYNRSTCHFNRDETIETFHLGNDFIVRNGHQVAGEERNDVHNVSFAILHNTQRSGKIVFSLAYKKENTPRDFTKTQFLYSKQRKEQTLQMLDNSGKGDVLRSSFTYREPVANGELLVDCFYGYLHHNGSRENIIGRSGMAPLYVNMTKTSGFTHYINSKGLYIRNLSGAWRVQTMLSDSYQYSSNNYTEEELLISKFNRNVVSLVEGLSFSNDKVDVNLLVRGSYNYTNILKYKKYNYFEPGLSLDVAYLFTESSDFNANFGIGTIHPVAEDLGSAYQSIDDFQLRKGNPDLNNGYTYNADFEYCLNKQFFTFNVYTNIEFQKNAIQEKTFLLGNQIVRMPDNFKYVLALKSGSEISFKYPKWLTSSVAFGYNFFKSRSKDQDKYLYGKMWFRANLQIYLRKWMLSCSFWTHNNDFYGEILETSGRMLSFSLLKTWMKGNLSTSLELKNPMLRNYSKQGVINHSPIAPYENWTYSDYSSGMLTFNVIYRFSVGRKSNSEKFLREETVNSGKISSSKSAEIR